MKHELEVQSNVHLKANLAVNHVNGREPCIPRVNCSETRKLYNISFIELTS